jgi:hypothetical protein
MYNYYLKYLTLYSNIIKNNVSEYMNTCILLVTLLICHPKLLMYLINKYNLQYPVILSVIIKISQVFLEF